MQRQTNLRERGAMKKSPPAILSIASPTHFCVDGGREYPLEQYEAVLKSAGDVQGIPAATLRAMRHCLQVQLPPRDQLLQWVSPRLLGSLYDYQRDGVAFAVAHGGRCMIADEMGVGKSRQGLAVLSTFRREWPALLLCPSSLKGQWRDLVREWVLREGEQVRMIGKGTDPLDGDVNIISYDLAANRERELYRFQVALVDESHYLKSRTAKRSKALLPVLKRARRLVLMSGTPALSRPAELFTQLNLLRPDIFPAFHAFGLRYCAAKRNHFGWDYKGASNLRELSVVVEATCVIRRTKADVLSTALPPKSRRCVHLNLSPEQLVQVDRSVEQLRTLEAKAGADPVSKKAAFLTVWRNVGRAKMPPMLEYLEQLVARGDKFLFFAHHQFVLDEAEAHMAQCKVGYIRIDGKTPPHHRTRMVDEFQGRPEVQVALLSITAAGCGLNLTAAATAVFGELYFNVGNMLQAEDRVHRVGQTRPVDIHYVIANGTVEMAIWCMLARKMETVGRIHGVEQQSFGAQHFDMSEFIKVMCTTDGATDTTDSTIANIAPPSW